MVRIVGKSRRGRPPRSNSRVYGPSLRPKGSRETIPMGFPQTQKMIMNYYYRSDYVNPTLPYAQFLWNLNSIRDPDRTGLGLQPALYDNMNAIYKRYRVYRADVTVDFYNNNDQPVVASLIYQGVNDTNVSNAVVYDPRALPKKFCRYVILSGNHLDGCKGRLKLSFNLASKDFEGKKVFYDDTYAGDNASNPNQTLIAGVNLCTLTGGNVQCYIMVSIKYHVIWEKPYLAEQVALD